MTRPARPSEGLPKLPVLMMSVGVVAGARGCRFKMLKTLNKLARNSNLALPRGIACWKGENLPKGNIDVSVPGPTKMLRQRQPGPRVVTSNSVEGLGIPR